MGLFNVEEAALLLGERCNSVPIVRDSNKDGNKEV